MLPPGFRSAATFAKGGDGGARLEEFSSVSVDILFDKRNFHHRQMSLIVCDKFHKLLRESKNTFIF